MSPERNPKIDKTLQTIYERLMRADSLRTLTSPRSPNERAVDHLQRLFAGQPSPTESLTSTARSEFLVTPEDLKNLDGKIGRAREWILKNGEYSEVAVVEGMPTYLRSDGQFEASAEQPDDLKTTIKGPFAEQIAEGMISKFSLHVNDGNTSFFTTLYLNGTFNIEIDFRDKERPGKDAARYEFGDIPLENMTKDEYSIISHYLDSYTKEVIENNRQNQ